MAGSIAEELLSNIKAIKFKQIVPYLPSGSGLSEHVYPCTVLAKTYLLDITRWLDGSFMNLGALFELFGEYSSETGLQVRKNLLKFLEITKKHGADKSNILKNSWIALHMHDLTMRQWANAMFMKDTLSDEIALYVLCKMYHRHVAMVTSAKIWSTVECDTPMSDEDLLSLCDLRLLYIELGVFGELKLKPAMPPAPPHLILESALDILPPDVSFNSDARGSTLNLMTCHISLINVDTGKNDWNIDAIGDNLSKFPLTPVSTTYNDCKLSGALECILLDVDV